jgi:hypothetical protein
MRDVMRLRTVILGLIVAMTPAVTADEPVSIRVSPAQSLAPATLLIQVKVEPHAGNRAVDVAAVSDGFYRSSTIPLDGDDGPKMTTLQYIGVPSGEYQVTAALITGDGKRKAVARAQVSVIGSAASH